MTFVAPKTAFVLPPSSTTLTDLQSIITVQPSNSTISPAQNTLLNPQPSVTRKRRQKKTQTQKKKRTTTRTTYRHLLRKEDIHDAIRITLESSFSFSEEALRSSSHDARVDSTETPIQHCDRSLIDRLRQKVAKFEEDCKAFKKRVVHGLRGFFNTQKSPSIKVPAVHQTNETESEPTLENNQMLPTALTPTPSPASINTESTPNPVSRPAESTNTDKKPHQLNRAIMKMKTRLARSFTPVHRDNDVHINETSQDREQRQPQDRPNGIQFSAANKSKRVLSSLKAKLLGRIL
jgi:hypothetical protein